MCMGNDWTLTKTFDLTLTTTFKGVYYLGVHLLPAYESFVLLYPVYALHFITILLLSILVTFKPLTWYHRYA